MFEMSINSVNLGNNNYQFEAKKAQSFGRKIRVGKSEDDMKSRKAAGIAITVGLVAATAITAYMFRGKIAQMPFVKEATEIGKKVVDGVKKHGGKVVEKGKEFAQKAKEQGEKIAEQGKKVSENVKKVAEEIAPKIDKLKEKGKEITKKVGKKIKK